VLLASLEESGAKSQAQLRQLAQQEIQRIDSEHAAAVEQQQQRLEAAMKEIAAQTGT
jgi:hypothetical protein